MRGPSLPATRRELESALEQHFYREVRLKLNGIVNKMAPTVKGMPDRLVLLPGGRIVLVELKAWNGELMDRQKLWHERAAALGTHVVVLTGRAEIDAWIRAQLPEKVKNTYKRRPAKVQAVNA